MAYGILLKGKAKVKCGFCSGVGFQHRGYDMHTCRVCGGKGFVSRVEVAERVLARFKQPKIYRVSHEHSDVLRYEGYVWDEVYMALQVLSVSGIKCQLTFPI